MGRLTTLQKLKSLVVVSTCSVGVFSAINVYKGNERFYKNVLMPVVHLLPPEFSHQLAVTACKYNLFPKQRNDDPVSLRVSFLGHQLSNPVGMAAGFDKHGEAIAGLTNIGFGFVEIGSVTPLPQEGNPRPRVFRLKEDSAIVNRYGFNSDGHSIVFERIQSLRKQQPSANGMIGINLGKNKNSSNAVSDYVSGVETFAPIADYIVINISSPNTPGLRSLQSENDLRHLLQNVLAARDKISNHVPIVLKLAPDLNDTELSEIAKVIRRKDCAIDGLIVSNTTIDRTMSLRSTSASEIGGLSGAPLAARSTEMIGQMYRLTKGSVPIIGVGGVFTGQDAYEKILAGASVVQIYTSFAYNGPPVVQKIKKELDALLTANGYSSVVEAVGKGNK